MKAIKTIIWVIFTILIIGTCISFALLNEEEMDIELLGWDSGLHPKWMLLFIFMGIGALLSTLFFAFTLIKLEAGNIRLRRANKKLERALLKQKSESSENNLLPQDPSIEDHHEDV